MYTKNMTKVKKKRTKKYSGADAAMTRPSVTRVTAVHRNKLQLWWLDRKRVMKPALITGAVVLAIAWLIFELIRATSGSL